jgi:hypothetical protein
MMAFSRSRVRRDLSLRASNVFKMAWSMDGRAICDIYFEHIGKPVSALGEPVHGAMSAFGGLAGVAAVDKGAFEDGLDDRPPSNNECQTIRQSQGAFAQVIALVLSFHPPPEFTGAMTRCGKQCGRANPHLKKNTILSSRKRGRGESLRVAVSIGSRVGWILAMDGPADSSRGRMPEVAVAARIDCPVSGLRGRLRMDSVHRGF